MDISSTYAPPINNACVPDIYNRLDAEVIERTRVVNNQLNMRLLLKQKIISKYKQEAERFLLLEKSRLAKELSRITATLPSAACLQEFKKNLSESNRVLQNHKKKNYLTSRNEDPICRRCYIHHLPTKKKFYSLKMHSPPPSALTGFVARVESHDPKTTANLKLASTMNQIRHDSTADPNPDAEDVRSTHTQDQRDNRLFPAMESFKFLEREAWGLEKDLNHSLTPRLMPNEIWKHVVKNVCSLGSKSEEDKTLHVKQNEIFIRDRTGERKDGTRSRRQSIISSGAAQAKTEHLPRSLVRISSKISIHRRQSVINESNNNDVLSDPLLSNKRVDRRRSSVAKIDKITPSQTGHILTRKNSKMAILAERDQTVEHGNLSQRVSSQGSGLTLLNKEAVEICNVSSIDDTTLRG